MIIHGGTCKISTIIAHAAIREYIFVKKLLNHTMSVHGGTRRAVGAVKMQVMEHVPAG